MGAETHVPYKQDPLLNQENQTHQNQKTKIQPRKHLAVKTRFHYGFYRLKDLLGKIFRIQTVLITTLPTYMNTVFVYFTHTQNTIHIHCTNQQMFLTALREKYLLNVHTYYLYMLNIAH